MAPSGGMHIASRLGEGPTPLDALSAALDPLARDADVVFVAAPPKWVTAGLLERLTEHFPHATVIGGTAGGVIGGGGEQEREAAISVTALHLPSCEARWLDVDEPDLRGDEVVVLALATPSALSEARMARLAALPVPVVGGLVSGSRGAERVIRDGAVERDLALLALSGDFDIETGVAQGCRPIGEPMIVVRAEGQLLLQLDAGLPLDVLRALHQRSAPEDQRRLREALFMGIQMRDQHGPYRAGDFLVRPLLGAEPDRGALAVGARLDGHPVVQFHVRDAESAREDLATRVQDLRGGAAGALMFTCLGRGEGLYGVPNHDAGVLSQWLFPASDTPAPLGGLFCNGEMGPVGGELHLHSYTAVWVAFHARTDAPNSRD